MPVKNRLSDLNDHLFAQIERLSDETLTPEEIDVETKRGSAIVALADQVIATGSLALKAATVVAMHGDKTKGMLLGFDGAAK